MAILSLIKRLKCLFLLVLTEVAYCHNNICDFEVIVYESKPCGNVLNTMVCIYPDDCWYVEKTGTMYPTYGTYKIVNDSLYICSKNSVGGDTMYLYQIPRAYKLEDNMLIYNYADSDEVNKYLKRDCFIEQRYLCDTLYQVYPAVKKNKKRKERRFFWYDCVRH
jgi:hypothetical protein